jgi:putative solute:sodium symporter small subunit
VSAVLLSEDGMAHSTQDRGKSRYWPRSLQLVGGCLLLWLLVTVLPLLVAQLGLTGTLLGWPIVFALAAFGVPIVYLLIIAFYSLAMDRVERDHSHSEREP